MQIPLGVKRRRKYKVEKPAEQRHKFIPHATNRRRLAAKIVAENPGISTQKALSMAGYTPSTARSSTHITKTKSWNELVEQYLPDKLLATKHKEFLTSPKTIKRFQRGDLVEVVEEVSPQATKALDMAYKLKNRYQDINVDKALIINVSGTVADKYKAPTIERYDGSTEPKNIESHNIHSAT